MNKHPDPFIDDEPVNIVWMVLTGLVMWCAIVCVFGFLLLPTTEGNFHRVVPLEAQIIELPPEPAMQSPHKASIPKVVHQVVSQIIKTTHVAPIVHHSEHHVEHVPISPAPSLPVRKSESLPAVQNSPVTSKSISPISPSPPVTSQQNSSTAPDSKENTGGGADMGPQALYQPKPDFPEDIMDDITGQVVVAQFSIHADGSFSVSFAPPTTNPQANQILKETLNRWKFSPAIQNGKTVASQFSIRLIIGQNE